MEGGLSEKKKSNDTNCQFIVQVIHLSLPKSPNQCIFITSSIINGSIDSKETSATLILQGPPFCEKFTRFQNSIRQPKRTVCTSWTSIILRGILLLVHLVPERKHSDNQHVSMINCYVPQLHQNILLTVSYMALALDFQNPQSYPKSQQYKCDYLIESRRASITSQDTFVHHHACYSLFQRFSLFVVIKTEVGSSSTFS